MTAPDRPVAGATAGGPGEPRADPRAAGPLGIEPRGLSDEELLRELYHVHRTRHATFRHGSDDALAQHDRRTAELEREYVRRFPEREVDERRLRP